MMIQEFANKMIEADIIELGIEPGDGNIEFHGNEDGWIVWDNRGDLFNTIDIKRNPWPEPVFEMGKNLMYGWTSVSFKEDLLDKIAMYESNIKHIKSLMDEE